MREKYLIVTAILILAILGKPPKLGRRLPSQTAIPIQKNDTNNSTNNQTSSEPKNSSANSAQSYFYQKLHTIRLEGNTTFTYFYATLFVGTPPQRQTVIVDTGSQLTAFPCKECGNKCGNHIDDQFDLKASSTGKKLKCNEKVDRYVCNSCYSTQSLCNWHIAYAEGSSLRGFMGYDYVVLGDEIQEYIEKKQKDPNYTNAKLMQYVYHERIQIAFGCTTEETHLFLTQDADGILGLGPNTNNPSSPPNIIDQIFIDHHNNSEKLVFSICYNNVDGGYMSVGGYNHDKHIPMAQTHIIKYTDSSFYTVNLHDIKINNETLKINKGDFSGAFIDSGTTLMHGPNRVIDPMIRAVNAHCDKVYCGEAQHKQTCYKYDTKDFEDLNDFFSRFPPIVFSMDNDFQFIWEGSSYLFQDPDKPEKNLYCFGFQTLGSASRIYLGGVWMRQYDILFDRSNRELHFTQADCSKNNLQSIHLDMDSVIPTTVDDMKFIKEIQNVDTIESSSDNIPSSIGSSNVINSTSQSSNNFSNFNYSQSSSGKFFNSNDSEQQKSNEQNNSSSDSLKNISSNELSSSNLNNTKIIGTVVDEQTSLNVKSSSEAKLPTGSGRKYFWFLCGLCVLVASFLLYKYCKNKNPGQNIEYEIGNIENHRHEQIHQQDGDQRIEVIQTNTSKIEQTPKNKNEKANIVQDDPQYDAELAYQNADQQQEDEDYATHVLS